MSDPILREEFDRVLDGITRAEARMTQRIDEGFNSINGRVRKIESRADVMESRLGLVERVLFAAIGLALATVALAIINSVVR